MSDHFPRCYRCMEIKGDSPVCPHCGYIEGTAPVNPSYLSPGTVLNQRYILGNLLDYNRESAVYIAYDSEVETVVEIKEFMPYELVQRKPDHHLAVQEEHLEFFQVLLKEFVTLYQGLAKIRTIGGLVQTYELFIQNNTYYVVTEHIKGQNIRDYLADHYGELSWEEASVLFLPALKSLGRLHTMGLIHGGISPETLYVDQKQRLKIGGFCVPSLRRENGKSKVELYDGYAAPEQYNNDEMCGAWTDVYSFAAVLYKTLTGTMPTDSKSRVCIDNLVPPNVLNPSVPKHISVAIMSAMTISAKIRTQSAGDFYADLATPPRLATAVPDEIVDDDEIEEQPSSKKYIFIAMGITGVILILISALILFFLFGGQSSSSRPENSSLSISDWSSSSSSSESSSQSQEESSSSESSSSDNQKFQMFDLVGRQIGVVQADEIYTSKIRVNVIEEVYSDTYDAGVIIWQSIEKDELITPIQTVDVRISKGKAEISLPDFHNENGEAMTLNAYTAVLQDAGISGGRLRIVYTTDSESENSTVLSVSPTVSTTINLQAEDPITITVVQNP